MEDPKSGIHYLVFTIKYPPAYIKLCIFFYLMGFGHCGPVINKAFCRISGKGVDHFKILSRSFTFANLT